MHAQQPPARRPAQREEEQDADRADPGVGGVGVQAAVDLQVGEREGLRVGPALERDPRSAAHGAVGAVAADQVAGPYLLGLSITVPEGAGHAVGVGLEGDQLHAPLHPIPAGGQVVVQRPLGLCLGDEQQEGVGGVGQPETEQPHPDDAAAGVELHPDRVVAALEQLLGDTQPAQHLQGAWLDAQRARFVDAIGLAVDDAAGRIERPELGGEGEAGRSGADD